MAVPEYGTDAILDSNEWEPTKYYYVIFQIFFARYFLIIFGLDSTRILCGENALQSITSDHLFTSFKYRIEVPRYSTK